MPITVGHDTSNTRKTLTAGSASVDYFSIPAAEAAGLEVRWVPIISGVVRPDDMAAFAAALNEMPKPMLAYCRTGTRCTMLWTILQHGQLADDEILKATSEAGYDMAGLLAQLSQRG